MSHIKKYELRWIDLVQILGLRKVIINVKVLLDKPLGWRMYLLLWTRVVYLHKSELNLLIDNLACIQILD